MDKKLLWPVGVLVVVAVGLAGLLAAHAFKKNAAVPASHKAGTAASTYGAKDACDYLTPAIAKKVLGLNAKKGDGTPMTAGHDVNVSTCVYSADGRAATLLVRAPLDAAGAQSNRQPFDNRAAASVNVPGYGDAAYWDASYGQLDVYKKGAWLILSIGTVHPADHVVDEAESLANLVVPNY